MLYVITVMLYFSFYITYKIHYSVFIMVAMYSTTVVT